MTRRQMTILKLCLSYAQSNMGQLSDAFAASTQEDPDNLSGKLDYNGEIMDSPTEAEFEQLHRELQG